jgi:hypothetical protein
MPNGTLRHRLDDFIGKYVLYYGVFFFLFLTRGMTFVVYRVYIVCRIWEGKIHYVKSP